MTCYNCGEPRHFVGNCSRPKICFICGIAGHHMNLCPSWKFDHPIAAYVENASQKLGFYHLEIPTVESTQWLNLNNCGVVRVKSLCLNWKQSCLTSTAESGLGKSEN